MIFYKISFNINKYYTIIGRKKTVEKVEKKKKGNKANQTTTNESTIKGEQ